MYSYNSLILIINIIILPIQIQSQKPNGPGISVCAYYSYYPYICDESTFDITTLPEECTSIFFDGLTVDLRYHIFGEMCSCELNAKVLNTLDELLKSGRSIYLFYGYPTQEMWSQVVACEESNGGINAKDEMKSLKAFLDEHPGVAGIVLSNLEITSSSAIISPNFSENFKKYVEEMRTSFPNLQIGIHFAAAALIDKNITSDLPGGLDFKVLEPALDFIIFYAISMNFCTADFMDIGVNPISASTTEFTLETSKSIALQAGIPKEKTYYGFQLDPTPNHDVKFPTICDLTTQEICLNKTAANIWCFDNQTALNDKGKFAKENGVGFAAYYMNFDDPTNLCKCEKPYASFYALLDGFNGCSSKACDLYSRGCET